MADFDLNNLSDEDLAKLSGRQLLTQALRSYSSPYDVNALNQMAQQRQQQYEQSLINSLAAGLGGKRMEPVRDVMLKQAMSNYGDQDIGGGYLSGGKFVEDPYAAGKRKYEALTGFGKEVSKAEQDALERAAEAEKARLDRLERSRLLAERNKPDVFGAGAATQIGTDDKGAPLFRDTSTGQLFNYVGGKPTIYEGQINPKTSNEKPSEDERKAAGWFAQADLAIRNMDEALKLDPNASIQPMSEVFTQNIPIFGEAITQSQRTGPRQMFAQASESMAEALLRAATGAGINESEARQKVRELVPVYGDKEVNIAQKKRGYKMYMAGLRARAGRAMPALEAALKAAYASIANEGDDGVVDLPPPGSP